MIKIAVGNGTETKRDIVSEELTIRQAFENAGFSCSTGQIMLNGSAINPGALDKSFAELGVTGMATLSCLVPKANA